MAPECTIQMPAPVQHNTESRDVLEGGRREGSNAKTEKILFFLPKGKCSSEVIKITNLEFEPETFSLAIECLTN